MRRTSFLFLGVFGLLLAFSVFLLATKPGLVLIQKGVNRYGGGLVVIGQVEGRLTGDLALADVRVSGGNSEINIKRISCAWRPAALFEAELHIVKLQLTGVDITVAGGPEGEEPPSAGNTAQPSAVQLPSVLLPFAVLLDSLEVDGLRIIDSDRKELFVVARLLAGLEGNSSRLSVHAFEVQGQDMGISLHGNIAVKKSWAIDIQGNWHLAGFGFHPMAGTFSAAGQLTNPHVEVAIDSPGSIRVSGDVVNLLDRPEWTAKLAAKAVDLSSFIEDCPKIELASVDGDLSGNFEKYRGHVQAEGKWDTLTGLQLVSDLDGDGLGIDFRSLRIDGKDSSAEADGGKISWRDIFSWQGRFHFENFDPSVITKELQGRISTELISAGDVQEHGVVASFNILSLNGRLREHQVGASGNVFLTETDVHTDGLTIRSGEVAGLAHIDKGLFSWAEEPSWSAKIHLDRFDPSWFNPDFSGSINGEITTAGKLGTGGLEGSLDIQKISGTLRGNQLSGGGEITLSQDTLQTTGLTLTSGRSELVLRGRAGERLALDFSLKSPDISAILPQGKGSVFLTGSLQGSRQEPQINAKVQGAGISYKENSLGRIAFEVQTTLKPNGPLYGSISAEEISLAGYSIDTGRIDLKGSLADHQMAVEGSGTLGKLTLKAHGSYSDEWRGQVSQMLFEAEEYGNWQQEANAAVTVGRNGVLLDRLCLADGASRVCLGGSFEREKEIAWTGHGELTSMPLKWLNRLGLISVPIRGLAQVEIAANGDGHRVVAAKLTGRVMAEPVPDHVKETEQVPLRFADSLLSMQLADGLLQGNFDIRMRNGSQVILAAAVQGAGDFSTPTGALPLTGSLALQKFKLGSLATFTGYGVEPAGWVTTSFVLGGTLGQPRLSGKAEIKEGGIGLPYQGITLENIALSIDAGEESVQLAGTATSGPGHLTVDGTIRYGAGDFEGQLNIKGDDFLLVNLPEYAIRVDPDLVLTFNNRQGEMHGTIDVPYALIAPEELSDSVSASEDVVIVNGTREERTRGWPITLNITVRLGDDVRVEGYGLASRLGGELKVYTTPDDSLAARGELDLIEGTFGLYGRTLRLERGRLLFTGGPIDNPGIDVRAQMKVSAEEAKGQAYTVGVDISGLVQDLQYHLFSDPYMNDKEILSLMIVGHSLADSTQSEGSLLEAAAVTLGVKGSGSFVQGIGDFLQLDDLRFEGSSSKENVSLVVGKRVTRKLYIGYDLNMFNQLGQFRVRYDLTRGFSVETRSSAESTGADLLYTFER